MAKAVALLRGINVGTAKRVAMADLRKVFEGLGYQDVRTVLQSGNVVFGTKGPLGKDAGRAAEKKLHAVTGVHASVLVFDGPTFRDIAARNPLLDVATNPSRMIVTFLGTAAAPKQLALPDDAALAPELIRPGKGALYQWLPDGVLATKVPKTFWKQFEAPLTARNWNTVTKLVALLEE